MDGDEQWAEVINPHQRNVLDFRDFSEMVWKISMMGRLKPLQHSFFFQAILSQKTSQFKKTGIQVCFSDSFLLVIAATIQKGSSQVPLELLKHSGKMHQEVRNWA